MKKLSLLAALMMLSTQAFATFGFDCESKDKTFMISGSTAAMPGNPLIGSLRGKINNQEVEIEKSHIAGFWNVGKDLKVSALDEDFVDLEFSLEAKLRFNRFPAKGKVTLKNGDVKKVTCIW